MVTRAVHLELVSTLSAEDFLATLFRFVSRMGQCSTLYRDNCLKFVGINHELKIYFAQSTATIHQPTWWTSLIDIFNDKRFKKTIVMNTNRLLFY